jgi:hypothetical protein
VGQHSRFAGRSAEEILGIAEGLASVAERFNQPVIQQPQEQPRNRFDLDLPADDAEYLQVGAVRRLLGTLANQPAPVDETARNLAAQAVYGNIRQQRADEFRRWQAEIDNEIRRLPVPYWTYDALNTIVNMVRANHVDELVAEKAQRLSNESHPTIRSGGGGSAGVSNANQTTLDSDTIPAEWLTKARAAGVTEEKVTEFCQATGQTREQYYADLAKSQKGPVIYG